MPLDNHIFVKSLEILIWMSQALNILKFLLHFWLINVQDLRIPMTLKFLSLLEKKEIICFIWRERLYFWMQIELLFS